MKPLEKELFQPAEQELVCIVCPMGCRLTLTAAPGTDKGWQVSGNVCKRGEQYALKELTDPTRVVTSTVRITGGILERLPVRTYGAIPKNKVFECMRLLNHVDVKSPVKMGDIVIADVLGTGVDVIATRSL